MKVCLLSMLSVVTTPPQSYGGAEQIHWDLVQMLNKYDHDVDLIALKGSKKPKRGSLIEIEPLNSYSELNLSREKVRLLVNKEVIDALKGADVILDCSDYKQGAQWVFDNLNHKCAMPYYTNGVYFAYPETHKNCVAESLAHARMAIQNATGYEGFRFPDISNMTRGILIDNCEVMYPPINATDFIYREEYKNTYFLTLGRFSPDKGQELIIEIAKRMPNETFMLAGSTQFEQHKDYYEKIIKPQAEQLKNVIIETNPTQERKKQLLSEAKATIMPSGLRTGFLESFGVVAVESLLSGTPVLVSPLGSLPEIITHKRSGFIFFNDTSLAKGLFTIESLKRKNCREDGLRFSYENVILQTHKLFDKLMRGEYW